MNRSELVGTHDFVPALIHDWLAQISGGKTLSFDKKYDFAMMLSNQFIFACDFAWEMVTKPSVSRTFQRLSPKLQNTPLNNSVDEVAVAAAVGDFDVLKLCAEAYGADLLWDVSCALGYPLAAAAGGGHNDIVNHFLDYIKMNYRIRPREQYLAALVSAIEESLLRGYTDTTVKLLDVYDQYFPAIPKRLRGSWLKKAIKDDRVYAKILALRTETVLREQLAELELACKANSADVLDSLLNKHRLNLNQGYLVKRMSLYCPLFFAVGVGHYLPVITLLHRGAHVDGVPTCQPCDLPLWRAIQRNDYRIVAILLLWGANIRSISELWNRSENQFKIEREAIGIHLRRVYDQRRERTTMVCRGHRWYSCDEGVTGYV